MNNEHQMIHEKAILISQNFKKSEIELIDILQLVMEKKIFLALGFASMYEYAISLGLSPANAYTYTKIAKVSKNIPELKTGIKNGSISITNARRIAPILTPENKNEFIEKAANLSMRELEKVVAAIQPEIVRESVKHINERMNPLKQRLKPRLINF